MSPSRSGIGHEPFDRRRRRVVAGTLSLLLARSAPQTDRLTRLGSVPALHLRGNLIWSFSLRPRAGRVRRGHQRHCRPDTHLLSLLLEMSRATFVQSTPRQSKRAVRTLTTIPSPVVMALSLRSNNNNSGGKWREVEGSGAESHG